MTLGTKNRQWAWLRPLGVTYYTGLGFPLKFYISLALMAFVLVRPLSVAAGPLPTRGTDNQTHRSVGELREAETTVGLSWVEFKQWASNRLAWKQRRLLEIHASVVLVLPGKSRAARVGRRTFIPRERRIPLSVERLLLKRLREPLETGSAPTEASVDRRAVREALPSALPQGAPSAPTSLTVTPLGKSATVSTGYNSAANTIVLSAGHGARFPIAITRISWWNSTDYAHPKLDPNYEEVSITGIAIDTLTIARGCGSACGGTTAKDHNIGGKTYKLSTSLATFGSTSSALQFTDNSNNETGFKIERNVNGAGFAEITQIGPNNGTTVNFIDKTGEILPESSVAYRVRAFNGSGNSAYSNEPAAVTLGAYPVPVAPTSPAATWGTTGITVTYSHADIGQWVCCGTTFDNTQFSIWRSESASGPWIEIGGALNAGSYPDRQWEFNKTYFYKVRGWHYEGFGPFSSVTSATATPTTPSAPVAAITTVTSAFAGEAVKFVGSTTTYTTDLPQWTGLETIYPYTWDFGDVPSGEDRGYNLREAEYVFRTTGVKTVTLTAYGPLTTTSRLVTDGVTNNSSTLTSATATFTSGDTGRKILLYEGSTQTAFFGTIASFTNSTTVTLSGNPGTTATGVTVIIAAAMPASNTTTHNTTIAAIPVTSDVEHECAVGESGGSVTAKHWPTNFATLQAAINASVGQNDALIELTTGDTDYVSPSATALLLKSQRTGTGYLTIRPRNYLTNFVNQRRVADGDVGNLAKINLVAVNDYDTIVDSEFHATNPVHHYRLQGIQVKKTAGTESQVISTGFSINSNASGGGPPLTTTNLPHDIILQHVYLNGDPQTNHWRDGAFIMARRVSILDSRLVNIKRNSGNVESYGILLMGDQVVVDNSEIYGGGMAIFLSGEETSYSVGFWQKHVTVRRNHLTRRAADRTNPYFTNNGTNNGAFSWKNIFEVKRGEFIMLYANMIGPSWPGGQDGTPILFTPANQSCDSAYTHIRFTQMKHNIVRDIAASGSSGTFIDFYARDGSCGGFADLSSDHYITNNLFFDSVGGSKPQINWFVGADVGEFVQRLVGEHNTVLTVEDTLSFGNGEWVGPLEQKIGLIYANNLHETGYVRGATNGAWNKKALDMYARDPYTFMGQTIEGGIGGHSDWAGIHTTNKFPAEIASIGWTDYAARDLRLSASSPYRAGGPYQATDGGPRGADLVLLKTIHGGTSFSFGVGTTKTETGDRSGSAQPGTPPAIMRGRINVRGRGVVRP